MRKPLDKLATALGSLLLALSLACTPLVSHAISGKADSATEVCRNCPCGKSGCCVDESRSAPQPAPATPVYSGGVLQELAGMMTRRLSLPLPILTDPGPPVGTFTFLPLAAVPLHARNCCFLI